MAAQVISHYRIVKKLGAGGMGEVYLAEDTKLGRRVAIKSLAPDSIGDERARKRLLREARAAARLDHPNICSIHEVSDADDSSFIVMQYVEGETLASLINQRKLTLMQSVDIAIQIAAALAEAHSHGIIHRDIKPQNIMVTPRGQVKVLDFGLAKLAQRGDENGTDATTQSLMSAAGGTVILGTAAYMSPEQARGEPVDARSDLFSLGAVLYECVTGSRAFKGANLVQICAEVLHVDPVSPSARDPQIPDDANRVISKALSKAPDSRYQTAQAMLADLEAIRGGSGQAPAIRDRVIAWLNRYITTTNLTSISRRKWILGSAAVLFIAAVIVGWYLSRRPVNVYPRSAEAQRRYAEGVNALRDGSYVKAIKLLGLAAQSDANFALPHARLAEAWLELDYRKKADREMLLARSLADRAPLSPFEDAYLQAANRTLVRDLTGSVEKYKEALTLAASEQKAFVYLDLGRTYERNEDIAAAQECFQAAVKIDPTNALATLRLGVVAARRLDSDVAEARFREAERYYRDVDNVDGVTEAVFLRGYLLNTKSELAGARATLEQALGRARALENQPQQVEILLHLSNIACSEGNTSKAEAIATDAVSLAKSEGMESLAVDGLIAVGNAFLVAADLDRADSSFAQAVDLARSYDGEKGENKALLAQASLNDRRSKPDYVIKLIETCLPYFERGNYKREASQALTLLARAHRKKGEYDAALGILQRSLELLSLLGDRAEIASCRAGMATVLSYREQYKDALEQYLQGSAIHESLGDKLSSGYDAMNIGRMLFQLGRYEEAEASFRRASEFAGQSGPNQGLQALIEIYAGRMALSQRHYAVAETRSAEGLRLVGKNSREEPILAKMTIGEAMAMSGRVGAGLSACRESVKLASDLNNPRHLSEARLALARALLRSSDLASALESAQLAEKDFDLLGKRDSLWRSLVVEAQCRERAEDHGTARALARRAVEVLSVVEGQLGEEAYRTYSRRPDVTDDRRQLDLLGRAN